eukprot:jgi/Ulvmu1/12248/UM086_0039.1
MPAAFCTPARLPAVPRRCALAAPCAGKGFGAAKQKAVTKKHQDKPHYVRNKGTCPCGSGNDFKACCGPIIRGAKEADTAEELMRSRFSAYCLRQVNYIVDTTHPDSAASKGSSYNGQQVSTLKDDVRATASKTEFHKLKILSTEAGGPQDEEGLVRFTIWFKTIGQTTGGQRDSQQPMQSVTELSSFSRRDGNWSYVNAVESDYTAHTY